MSIQGLDAGSVATKLQELVKAGEKLPRCGWLHQLGAEEHGSGDNAAGGLRQAYVDRLEQLLEISLNAQAQTGRGQAGLHDD